MFRQWRLEGGAAMEDPCRKGVWSESSGINASVECNCLPSRVCRITSLCVFFTLTRLLPFTPLCYGRFCEHVIDVWVWNILLMQKCEWAQEHLGDPAGAIQFDRTGLSVSFWN